jgi:hypothetical protein
MFGTLAVVYLVISVCMIRDVNLPHATTVAQNSSVLFILLTKTPHVEVLFPYCQFSMTKDPLLLSRIITAFAVGGVSMNGTLWNALYSQVLVKYVRSDI